MDFHYIYQIINLINGKYYIGKHSTNKIDDNYLGSGTLLIMALKKYGRDKFKKEIIQFCKTEQEDYQIESELVTNEEVNDPMCYNAIVGGKGGNSNRRKKIAMVEKVTFNKLRIFDSAAEANEYIGRDRRSDNIAACARGEVASSAGFYWEYIT